MKKILVTGGLGYIGSHTVVELQSAGYDVVVIDNLDNSTEEVKERIVSISGRSIDLVIGDVNDQTIMNRIFKEHDFYGVVHFAAYKAVGESVDNPIKYYENNVSGLITLLGAMERHGVQNLIFSSSCTVYGIADDLPVTEDTPIKSAESPYGTTKIIGEEIIQDYAKHKNIKTVLLRYFNPVGAHPSAQIGELPNGVPSNLVPYIMQTAAGIREQLVIHGNDYNTSDGTCIRDYIHVVDLAKAHVKAMTFADKMPNSVDVFNVGTGHGSTVLEVVKAFEERCNIRLNYRIGPRREGDVEQIFADTHKINDVLQWQAEYDLHDMIYHAWMWQKRISRK
ncbi:MAG: UDP-glucose 4-epimerase GalE [Bacteroidia bacterium]|nr:UDP-glucose 4-epimerase GalE [Bacteroidia bacterium]MDG2042384.1 UDP-glucose 4-epimerase GalE [Bacteroidia bacterium]|tara:strand:- start:112 stop:1122 length:1011 start_codon:yes stop_codon:yes gene_type:complete